MTEGLTLEKIHRAIELLSQEPPEEENTPNRFKVTAWDGSYLFCNRYEEAPTMIGFKQWVLQGGSLRGKFLVVHQSEVTIEPLSEIEDGEPK
jgi:hypothetical protein